MCLTGSRRIVPHMRDAPYLALRLSACAVKNWAAVKRTRDSRCRAEPTAIHCHYSTRACYFGCCGTGTERLSRTRRTAAPEFRLATPRRVCAEELCVVVGGSAEFRPARASIDPNTETGGNFNDRAGRWTVEDSSLNTTKFAGSTKVACCGKRLTGARDG
jgi:hypothetical protein